MRLSNGSDWWDSGHIPLKLRTSVDKLIHEERISSWQVTIQKMIQNTFGLDILEILSLTAGMAVLNNFSVNK
jgi:hypothetical protein